jgi:hypothetical protein
MNIWLFTMKHWKDRDDTNKCGHLWVEDENKDNYSHF